MAIIIYSDHLMVTHCLPQPKHVITAQHPLLLASKCFSHRDMINMMQHVTSNDEEPLIFVS